MSENPMPNKTPKITFVSYYNLTDRMAAAARLRRMVEYFELQGWKVLVITPHAMESKPGRLHKLYTLVKIAATLSKNAKKITDTDIYYVTTPPIFLLFTAFFLKSTTSKKLVLEERDLLTLNPLLHLQWLRGNTISRQFETKVLNKADLVVTPTTGVKSDLDKHWPKLRKKTIVVRNGFWKKDYLFLNNHSDQKKSQSEPLTLIHTGNFYGSRNPLPLLEALKLLNKNHPEIDFTNFIKIRFIGQFANSRETESFFSKAKFYGLLDLFTHEMHLPHEDSLKEIASSDIALLITHTSGSENAIPAKLFEYIAIGRPILAITNDPLVVDPIQKNHLGWCFGHHQIEELSQKLFEWFGDKNLVRDKKLPGLSLSEFDSENQLKLLKTNLERLLGDHR